jgi:hypothetical protein
MIPTALLASAALLSAQAPGAVASRDVDLDHIIIAVPSLRAGIVEFADRTGVTAVIGGQHPGRGTENALASLGQGHYLELLAPIVADSAPGAAKRGLRLVGWAVHTRTLPEVIGRLKAAGFRMSGPTAGSRRKPDGTMLSWRTGNLEPDQLPLAPFVIEWGTSVAHPSTTSPGGCRLVRMTLETGDSTRLRRFFDAIGHEVMIRSGPAERMQVELACPKGSVMLTT